MLLHCQMLTLMEAQSHFFQHGHQSLSELDDYRQKLSEEAGFLFGFPSNSQNKKEKKQKRCSEGLELVNLER